GSGGILVFTTLVSLAVIGGASMYRIASLRGGGEAVALQFGGTPVPEDTTDRYLQRLRNVVEEIAIASGVPMPGLYVLEHESAINAFAAGYSPSDAAIAVTRGALEKLNRDELQGVIAHEFSHILNGDMRLNIRLIGVLFGIMVVGIIGRRLMLHGGMSRNGRDATVMFLLVALVAIVIGYIGLLFGRMIKAGISRTRESLADASAVQFTRQTAGLAGALKKIAGVYEGSRLGGGADTEEISHMLFGEGMGFSGLFATHPPILKRIQALEPGFNAAELERLQVQWRATPPNGLQEDARMGLAGAHEVLPAAATQLNVTPAMVAAQVAQPESDDYRRADAIVFSIPDALRELARDREQVMPLLLAMLLGSDQAVLGKQRIEIASRMGNEMAEAAFG